MKSFRKTLILLVVLVIAGGFYWYYEVKKKKEKEELKEKEAILFEKKDTDIVKLFLQKKGEEPIVIERIEEAEGESEQKGEEKESEDKWKITVPVQTPGDSYTIRSLINTLKEAKREEIVQENLQKLKDYGLEEPEFSVRFNYRGEEEPRGIDFGIKTLDNKRVFAKVSGSENIVSVPVELETNLKKSLFDLRDKRICPVEKDDIVKVSMLTGTTAYVLEKKGEDEWYFSDGVKASASRVDLLTGTLRWGNFSEVVEESAESMESYRKYGFERPRLFLNLELKNGDKYSFIVGDVIRENEAEFYYATRSTDNMIFQVKADTVHRLVKSRFELKDRHIFNIPQQKVTGLTFKEKGGEEYRFVREGDKWKFSDSGEVLERSYKIDNIIRGILESEYEEHEPIKRGQEEWENTGISDPRYILTFEFDDGTPPLTVKLTEKDEQTYKLYLTPDDGETVYYTSGYFVNNFPQSREELLE